MQEVNVVELMCKLLQNVVKLLDVGHYPTTLDLCINVVVL